MNNNEMNFSKYLEKSNISYEVHYFNKIKYPDFDKLFPVNTSTGSTIISSYHSWDFKVHTLESDVFVDIDGSVHDPKNKTTGITEFNDSKRPYQTDGLPAYAVLCYDDNLTDDTPVKNIITNEIMSFKQFMALIAFMNMDEKELKDLEIIK